MHATDDLHHRMLYSFLLAELLSHSQTSDFTICFHQSLHKTAQIIAWPFVILSQCAAELSAISVRRHQEGSVLLSFEQMHPLLSDNNSPCRWPNNEEQYTSAHITKRLQVDHWGPQSWAGRPALQSQWVLLGHILAVHVYENNSKIPVALVHILMSGLTIIVNALHCKT